MRDRLIHLYIYDLVWRTIKDVVRAAKSGIRKILEAGWPVAFFSSELGIHLSGHDEITDL